MFSSGIDIRGSLFYELFINIGFIIVFSRSSLDFGFKNLKKIQEHKNMMRINTVFNKNKKC